MTEWKTYRLGDICKRVCSGGTPKSTEPTYYDGDIPWLNTKEINFNRIYSTERCITQKGLDNSSAKWIDANCVIVAMYGATAAKVAINKIPLTTNQACCNLSIDEKIADYNYVYYWLCANYTELASLANGGAQQNLNAQQIKDFEISLPGLEEQRRIAGILGAIDDKIENNRRINTNLELQAQALYKQWFVDNRSDDWEEKQLGEIALHITDGVHNTVIDSPNGEYYLLSCKNIKSGQLFIGSNERRIDHETFTKLRKRTRLSHGDILVTSVGTVGEMYLVNESPSNYEFQRSVAIIKPNNDIISSYFLYAALLYQQNEIKHLAHGAVQQCIFISDLKEYSLIVPNKDDISAFDAVVAPMFNKIGELQKENETLATLRDTLLPKLMNGEIKL